MRKIEQELEPALMSTAKACAKLSIRHTKLYELVREGKLHLVKTGPKQSRITTASMKRFIESLPKWP